MTSEQLARWIDFARRMVLHGSRRMKPGHRKAALDLVEEFLDLYGCGIDGDPDAPAGWTDWDSSDDWHGTLCDLVDNFLYDRRPRWCLWWRIKQDAEAGRPMKSHPDAPDDEDSGESRYSWWLDASPQVTFRCAIRAGIDVACEPSAGVLGYTVGDLRRMYPEGLPQWLVDAYPPKEPGGETLSTAPDVAGVWL